MLLFYSSVFLFFCFSFSGWLLETAAAAVRTHRYVDRSVLFGPLCIVYGVGGLMMVHLLGELRGNWLFLFLGCAIYATVVEWVAGHLLEAITHTRWWDYSNHRWNLDGYVSLSTSLLWGLMGLAVVQWGTPLLMFVYRLVPSLVMHITLWVLLGVLAVEMESAALYLNAARAGKNALAICTISDHLSKNESLDAQARQSTFTQMMEIALDIA